MKRASAASLVLALVACGGRPRDGSEAACCTRAAMVADLRALEELLETSHPEPFARAGGPEAFHARFDEVARRLPARLDPPAFARLLAPLAAQVRDGHTYVRVPAPADDRSIAIDLDVIGNDLVVRAIPPDHRGMLGARVLAVESVPLATLAARSAERRGPDNPVDLLRHVATALTHTSSLGDLLGAEIPPTVRWTVRLADGSTRTVDIAVGVDTALARVAPKVTLPALDATGIGSGFLDPDGRVAMLRIDSAMRYREAFEVWRATGLERNLAAPLDAVFTAATGAAPPRELDLEGRIHAIPSFTARLVELFGAMRERRTQRLVVDVRENQGGNSTYAEILEYFLAPIEDILARDQGYQVPRYSRLYFENFRNDSLAAVRARTHGGFALGDLDRTEENAWREARGRPLEAAERARRLHAFEADVSSLPSVRPAVPAWNAAYRPAVTVLTSARTYSAGFETVLRLRAHGATVVGVPSAQSANGYIDGLAFELPRSHVRGSVSYKKSVRLPADPAAGNVLRPDFELTYPGLAAAAFDPDAVLAQIEVPRP